MDRELAESEARGITDANRFPIEHVDAIVRYGSVDPNELAADT